MVRILLPPHATPFEKSLETITDLKLDPDILRGFRFVASTSLHPFLIEEYGLGELQVWLPDPSLILKEGLLFQRLRGTVTALRMALRWIGLDNITIEEAPPGNHFAEYQIGCEEILPDFRIEAAISLSKLSSPARSRLKRIYNSGFDIRHLVLDEGMLGDYLSDYSGVKWKEELILSFGRKKASYILMSSPLIAMCTGHHLYIYAKTEDNYLLDYATLGETLPSLENRDIIHVRELWITGIASLSLALHPLVPLNYFSRAMIILSDSAHLGETNACFGPVSIKEEGEAFILGKDKVSEHKWKFVHGPILERFDRAKSELIPIPYLAKLLHFFSLKEYFAYSKRKTLSKIKDQTPIFVKLGHFYTLTRYEEKSYWYSRRYLKKSFQKQGPILTYCSMHVKFSKIHIFSEYCSSIIFERSCFFICTLQKMEYDLLYLRTTLRTFVIAYAGMETWENVSFLGDTWTKIGVKMNIYHKREWKKE